MKMKILYRLSMTTENIDVTWAFARCLHMRIPLPIACVWSISSSLRAVLAITHIHTQIRTRPPPSSSSHTRRERGGKTHTTILAMTSNMYEKVRMHLSLHCQLNPFPQHNHHALHQKKEELSIRYTSDRAGRASIAENPKRGSEREEKR